MGALQTLIMFVCFGFCLEHNLVVYIVISSGELDQLQMQNKFKERIFSKSSMSLFV